MKWLFILALFFMLGCTEAQQKDLAKGGLPIKATDVQYLGNGWLYFRLDNHKYLFRASYSSDTNYTVTEVSE
jgi:hypothetical protein